MPTDGRDAKGRFRKGVCPNPNGRPRKAKAEIGQQIIAILQEEVPTGGKTMPMSEVLIRSYIREALKNPRMFISLLPYMLAQHSEHSQASDATTGEDEATIEAFLKAEREKVRRQRQADEPDHDDGED